MKVSLPLETGDFKGAPQGFGHDESVFNLRLVIASLLDNWVLVVSILLFSVLAGLLQAWLTTPQYESSALVEIESRSSGLTLGTEIIGAPPYWMPEATGTQIEILKSRRILGAAAQELGLTISARPRYLGPIGRALARRHTSDDLADAPWFVPFSSRFAWGGEKIAVASLDLGTEKPDRELLLVAGEDGRYDLLSEEREQIGQGNVGVPLTAKGVTLLVSNLRARKGTEFFLRVLQEKEAADILRDRLKVVERGARGALGGTGILGIRMLGESPVAASNAANAVANAYLRQNVERLSQGAERKLEFLNSQLPRLQAEVEAAEQALLSERTKSGPYQLSEGSRTILDALTRTEREISELDLQRTELSQTLTPEHPAIAAVIKKLEQLKDQRAQINAKISSLPDIESRLVQLTRDQKVASELYVALLNKVQELKIAKAGTIGNVHIIDSAVPVSESVEPNVARLMSIWIALGLVMAVVSVSLREHLSVKINWASDVEKRLGIPVYTTIPFSARQESLDKAIKAGERVSGLLAETDPGDAAVESLRSLRAGLHFAMMEAKRNLVVVTGSTPGVGKTFVAANLARLIADSGRKVLLIDADLRKGRMHTVFGIDRSPGLSDVIAGKAVLEEVRRPAADRFSVVTTGRLPPNPADLLASDEFIRVVENSCRDFDFVIIDTPPILNLADAVVIAKSAGALFVTIRGGVSTVPDVADCIQRFAKNGIRVDGLILNGMRALAGSYMRSEHYQYRYRYGK